MKDDNLITCMYICQIYDYQDDIEDNNLIMCIYCVVGSVHSLAE